MRKALRKASSEACHLGMENRQATVEATSAATGGRRPAHETLRESELRENSVAY